MSDSYNSFVNLRKNIVPEASEEVLKKDYFLKDDIGNGFSFVSNKEKYLKEIDSIFTSSNGLNYYISDSYIKDIERTINDYKKNFETNKERQINILTEYKNIDNFYNKISIIESDYEKKINNKVSELKSNVLKLLSKYQGQIVKIKAEENENSSLNKVEINTTDYYGRINNNLDSLDDNNELSVYIDKICKLYNKYGEDLQKIVYTLRSNNTESEINDAKKEIENSIIGSTDNIYVDQRLKDKILNIKNRLNKENSLALFNELSEEINFFKDNYQISRTVISSGVINNFKNKLNSINNNFSKTIDILTKESLDNGKGIKKGFDVELDYIKNRYINDISNIKNDTQSKINIIILELSSYLDSINSKITDDLSKNGFIEIAIEAKKELDSNLEIERDSYIKSIGVINSGGSTGDESSDSKYFIDDKETIETEYKNSLKNAQNNIKQIIDDEFSYLKFNINTTITNYLRTLTNIRNQFTNENSNIMSLKNKCINSLNEIEKFINNLNITTTTTSKTNPYYVYVNMILGGDGLNESIWQNYMDIKDDIRKENSAAVKEYLLNNSDGIEDGINIIYNKSLYDIDDKINTSETNIRNFENNVTNSISLDYPAVVVETTRAYENVMQNINNKYISKNNSIVSEINSFIDLQKQNLANLFNEIENNFIVSKYQNLLKNERNKLDSITESIKYDLSVFTNEENININNYINMYKNKKSTELLEEFENNILAISNELKKRSSDKIDEANSWLIDIQKKVLGYDSCYFINNNYLEAIDLLYAINKKISN